MRYAAQDLYPMHMPGHKRRCMPAPGLPADWDVTEVPGTDDLHHAEGILAEAMARTARLWGAARTWYLIGGSTCGILAAIRAAALQSSSKTILCARNCHKSVYYAIELCGLSAHWLVPPAEPVFGVYASISVDDATAALDDHPDAACMVLTSPTYEGVLSDIASIAKLCHSRGVPLIVDEAHGAHYLPLAAPYGWQGGAVAAGADLVIQSAHKTLPSLTQTALLHLNGDRIDPGEIRRQLEVFETSSPSYPLLASLDGCTGLLAARGEALFSAWRDRLDRFDVAVKDLKHLRILCHGGDAAGAHPTIFAYDRGKILVSGGAAGQTGAALAQILRTRFCFETEMACGENVLAMTSPCDEESALDRFAAALVETDSGLQSAAPAERPLLPPPGKAIYTISQAAARPKAVVSVEKAVGRAAGEYVWAYPPGVPLIAPGEEITPAFLAACQALEDAGTELRHTGGGSLRQCAVCS